MQISLPPEYLPLTSVSLLRMVLHRPSRPLSLPWDGPKTVVGRLRRQKGKAFISPLHSSHELSSMNPLNHRRYASLSYYEKSFGGFLQARDGWVAKWQSGPSSTIKPLQKKGLGFGKQHLVHISPNRACNRSPKRHHRLHPLYKRENKSNSSTQRLESLQAERLGCN